MTRIIRLLLCVALFVLVQPFLANAAEDDGMGGVNLTWSVTYTPFSWKFSIDPFPLQNGSLSMSWKDPSRVQFIEVLNSQDYVVSSQGSHDDGNGQLLNIRFQAGPQGPPSSALVDVFEVNFDDLAQGLFPGPEFTVFAGNGDGFNFPLISGTTSPDYSKMPEFTPGEITPFFDQAPVPEPGSLMLVSLGALGLLAFRRRN